MLYLVLESTTMIKLSFDNKDTFHCIGLGTWKATGNEIKTTIVDAIHAGYRHIDTAAVYGNEVEIGEALASVFKNGEVKREDIFITSKLWNNAHHVSSVIPALKESLKKLQLDYLDLYLIHWPVAFKSGVLFPRKPTEYIPLEELPIIDTWKQMEIAKKEGLARHIGVSNFSKKKLQNLISKAESKPEINQVELHPLLQQDELLNYCNSEGILITGYSPLGSGDRSLDMKNDDEPSLMDLEVIINIAAKHNATPAQVLIAWHCRRGTSVIPKSTNIKHMTANYNAFDIVLDDVDMRKIETLDKNYRFINGSFFEMPGSGYSNIYDE